MEKNVLKYWGVHDPASFRDDVTGLYYEYSTGAKCMKSSDLIHWEDVGIVVKKPPKEAVNWTESEEIWAPDIVKVGDEYRLYCSNSSWGVRQSCIFLAVSSSPEGPFEPRGIVMRCRVMQSMQISLEIRKRGRCTLCMVPSGEVYIC